MSVEHSNQGLDAHGRSCLVTGANSGIGYFVAEQLACAGAAVVLGCRNVAKAATAVESIRSAVPGASVRYVELDLGDPDSVRTTPERLPLERLDTVVCNAGVLLEQPTRRETGAGNELALGINHLGHFTLIGQLASLLGESSAGRVVTTGSFLAKSAELDTDDIQFRNSYQPKEAYARSKLAQMLCAFELDRRLRAAGSTTTSVVNHPGGALDSLTPSRAPLNEVTRRRRLLSLPARVALQGKHAGAWPAVRAALDPAARGGELYGPRIFGMRGSPRIERVNGKLADRDFARRVWEISVELTGVDPFVEQSRP